MAGNLNGKQDLVFGSGPMMVQFNNGSGVMTTSNYAVGGGPMVLGDFNGDGRQDIAAGRCGWRAGGSQFRAWSSSRATRHV